MGILVLHIVGFKIVEYSTRANMFMHGHTYSKSVDQPGKVANPARGQLNREMNISVCVRA